MNTYPHFLKYHAIGSLQHSGQTLLKETFYCSSGCGRSNRDTLAELYEGASTEPNYAMLGSSRGWSHIHFHQH